MTHIRTRYCDRKHKLQIINPQLFLGKWSIFFFCWAINEAERNLVLVISVHIWHILINLETKKNFLKSVMSILQFLLLAKCCLLLWWHINFHLIKLWHCRVSCLTLLKERDAKSNIISIPLIFVNFYWRTTRHETVKMSHYPIFRSFIRKSLWFRLTSVILQAKSWSLNGIKPVKPSRCPTQAQPGSSFPSSILPALQHWRKTDPPTVPGFYRKQ